MATRPIPVVQLAEPPPLPPGQVMPPPLPTPEPVPVKPTVPAPVKPVLEDPPTPVRTDFAKDGRLVITQKPLSVERVAEEREFDFQLVIQLRKAIGDMKMDFDKLSATCDGAVQRVQELWTELDALKQAMKK